MLQPDQLYKFIVQEGFRTLTEIKAEFKDDDEVLSMTLTFLLDKNNVRKVKIQRPKESDELYYISC